MDNIKSYVESIFRFKNKQDAEKKSALVLGLNGNPRSEPSYLGILCRKQLQMLAKLLADFLPPLPGKNLGTYASLGASAVEGG